MKKALLSLVLLAGLTLSLNGHFTWNNIARAQATAVPSCQFAGYNPNGSLINTTIVCVSPVASGGAVTTVGATATACGAAVAPSPTGGAVVVQVPVCPTASAGPGLPLSVSNGGTGVSSPNPTGTNGCTVGTFPNLVVSCPSSAPITLPLSVANGGTGTSAPAPTSSNGCTITGTWPSQTFSCPTAAAGNTPNPYASTVLAETSATHFWPMSDAAPCTTVADAIAGGATAAPSPVSLTVVASPLPSPAGSPAALQCGAPGIIKNGTTSIEWLGQQGIPAYLSVPSPVFETLCKAGGGTCNQPFTLECIVSPGNSALYTSSGFTYLWSIDTSTDLSLFITYPGGGDGIYWQSFGSQNFGAAASGVPLMIDYEFDGTAQSYWFINGTLAATKTISPSMVNASLSFFGWDGASAGAKYWNGRVHGCSTYNTMLSIAKILTHYAATGLP